ncbi:hypothetical protein BGZ99_006375 [Dissophora globulifera]|uniref:Uncharacterized protein n=1 Tax=Dissophora globulifera TaxID=979702 RepID=A0A9P6UYN7_9FUNG|nr:hypothetical protein BGZ99_006375 [Dissophora globulifera]
MSRLRVEHNDTFLRDGAQRAWLLRGVNVSGSCKFPRYPVPVPSHVGGNAFLRARNVSSAVAEAGAAGADVTNLAHDVDDSAHAFRNDLNGNSISETRRPQADKGKHDRISFVGRPFELSEADEHLARLRHWGFRMIRWVVTWEAIEHQGPGQYDQEFLNYTVKALLKTKECGFKVMIDFHQDVWSRFSGGSGAPLWTFYAAGLDPHHFAATRAATVHNTLHLSQEPLLRMVWLTNYYKLACATLFTLFYAGRILAPGCTFDNGVNIQDYLQSHFLGAIRALVDRIHACTDDAGEQLLEDHVVIGYDSWNEPSCGWIGLDRLDVLPEQHDLRQGDMPTPLQSLMLGEGLVTQDVATYKLELVGPVKSGSRTIDPSAYPSLSNATESSGKHRPPSAVKAWLTSELRDTYDIEFGIRRDQGFPMAETCLWAQLGVWSIHDRKILQQDYFSRGPASVEKHGAVATVAAAKIDWVQDHWLPFARRVIDVVRNVHPTAILFLEPPVYVPPPHLPHKTTTTLPSSEQVSEESSASSDDTVTTNMVYAPHHYDDLVLLTKRYLGWVNLDLLGLSRGRHKSLFGSIVIGKKATKSLFGRQIGEIQKECYERLGRRPVFIGETGLHFDVGLDKSRQSANIKDIKASTTTNIVETNPTALSKQFQHAFDNILNGLDRTLAHYTLWNYTIENDAMYGDGWNGENLSLYTESLLSHPSLLSGSPRDRSSSTAPTTATTTNATAKDLDRGGRAIEQFCRPYPIATVGQPVKLEFDRHQKTFKLWTRSTTTNTFTSGVAPLAEHTTTEIYIPRYHFAGPNQCVVTTSDGSWVWNEEDQLLHWTYGKNVSNIDHWIAIHRKRT